MYIFWGLITATNPAKKLSTKNNWVCSHKKEIIIKEKKWTNKLNLKSKKAHKLNGIIQNGIAKIKLLSKEITKDETPTKNKIIKKIKRKLAFETNRFP